MVLLVGEVAEKRHFQVHLQKNVNICERPGVLCFVGYVVVGQARKTLCMAELDQLTA